MIVASFKGDSKDRNGRWIKNGADPTIVKFMKKQGRQKNQPCAHPKFGKFIV